MVWGLGLAFLFFCLFVCLFFVLLGSGLGILLGGG